MKAWLAIFVLGVAVALPFVGHAGSPPAPSYDDLQGVFDEFRRLAEPELAAGAPDYSPEAVAAQRQALGEMQRRLAGFEIESWPIAQQVDYHLVRAEMNGLDFYHRVMKPWSRDPAFYLQTQGGAGPTRRGTLRIEKLPMLGAELEEFASRLRAVPGVLADARVRLENPPADLALLARHYLPEEMSFFDRVTDAMEAHHPDLVSDAKRARDAVASYGQWLDENADRMTAPAGIGKESYNWWLRNVQLVPYTWDDFWDHITREDERVVTFLALERNRNRHLPELEPVRTQEEHAKRKLQALEFAKEFLRDADFMTVPDDLDALGYLSRGPLAEPDEWPGERDFFDQTGDREPLPEQVHEFIGHYLDGQIQARDTRPIRGRERLFAIDMIRSEGWAFGLEELLMHAGYLDGRSPRGREIVYEQTAFRTCRAIADMKMHANEFTLQEAIDFCYACAPNGWLLPDGYHVWYEMETNLRFPGWHSGMVIGKGQFMKLFGDRARQQSDAFELRAFIDEFLATGNIPFALIRWELTGLDDEMAQLWSP